MTVKNVKMFDMFDAPYVVGYILRVYIMDNIYYPVYAYQVGTADKTADKKDGQAKEQWQAVDNWFRGHGAETGELIILGGL